MRDSPEIHEPKKYQKSRFFQTVSGDQISQDKSLNKVLFDISIDINYDDLNKEKKNKTKIRDKSAEKSLFTD